MERHLRLVPRPPRAKVEDEMDQRVRVSLSYRGSSVPEGWMRFGTVILPGEKPATLYMSASGTGLSNKKLHATVELSDWARFWTRIEFRKAISKAECARRKTPLPIVRELRKKMKHVRRNQEVDSHLFVAALHHTQQIAFDEVELISLIDLMNPKTLWMFLEHLGPFAGRSARVVAAIEDRIRGIGGEISSQPHQRRAPPAKFL